MVRVYEDAAPPASRRIKGRFVSATDDFITLVLKSGQTRNVHKQDVRKVLTFRPFGKRWQGWVAVVATFLFVEAAYAGDLDRRSHFVITPPIAAGAFFASWKKGVYKVPPKHRMLLQGDQ